MKDFENTSKSNIANDAIKEIENREHQVTMKRVKAGQNYGEMENKAIELKENLNSRYYKLSDEIGKIKKENDSPKEQMMFDIDDNQNYINNRIDSVVSQFPISIINRSL